MSLFKNGNRRIARLMLWEIGAGCAIIALAQILGNLPSQDWLTPREIKIIAFFVGISITLLKSAEMFFSKTVSLFKDHVLPDDLSDTPPTAPSVTQPAAPTSPAPV